MRRAFYENPLAENDTDAVEVWLDYKEREMLVKKRGRQKIKRVLLNFKIVIELCDKSIISETRHPSQFLIKSKTAPQAIFTYDYHLTLLIALIVEFSARRLRRSPLRRGWTLRG